MKKLIDIEEVLSPRWHYYTGDGFYTEFKIEDEKFVLSFIKELLVNKPMHFKCSLYNVNIKSAGVYLIRHMETQQFYIGSSENVYKRIVVHKNHFTNKEHRNINFKNLINVSKLSDFEFVILFTPDRETAYRLEQHLLNKHKDNSKLMNIALDVKSPMLGMTASEETKTKMSLALKGLTRSDEVKDKISALRKVNIATINQFRKVLEAKRRRIMVHGKEYISLTQAGQLSGIAESTLRRKIRMHSDPEVYFLDNNASPLLGRSISEEKKKSLSHFRKTDPAAMAQIRAIAGLNKKKIIFNGVAYDSILDASRATGVAEGTIRKKASTLLKNKDNVLTLDYLPIQPMKVSVLGKIYSGRKEASETLGISMSKLKLLLKQNSSESKNYFYIRT
jgi:group I intron endonuclease